MAVFLSLQPIAQATTKETVTVNKGTPVTPDMTASKVSTAQLTHHLNMSWYSHCLHVQQLRSVRWEVTHRIRVDILRPVDVQPTALGQTIVPVSFDESKFRQLCTFCFVLIVAVFWGSYNWQKTVFCVTTSLTLHSVPSLFEQLPLPQQATDMETPHPMLVTRISQLPLVTDGARASNGLGLLPISSTTIINESPFPLGLSLLLSRGTSTKPLIPSRYHISRSQTLHDLSHPHTCSLVLWHLEVLKIYCVLRHYCTLPPICILSNDLCFCMK